MGQFVVAELALVAPSLPALTLLIAPYVRRECPDHPANQAAQARILQQPHAAAILATQQLAACHRIGGGGGALIEQLAACLEQQALPAGVSYSAYLCAPVEHYQSQAHDQGWGEPR